MKIRSQIGMVLNLDKCIGCHTCSITCKNVWTSREGMEYAWFNNVETKPGIGYPKEWENQDKWKGGWVRNANGSINPRIGGKFRVLANIFANPDLPRSTTTTSRSTSTTSTCTPRRWASTSRPRVRVRWCRQAHGEDRVGPQLGGNPRHRVRQAPQGQELRPDPGTSTASTKTPS
jgi:hypothetical protein